MSLMWRWVLVVVTAATVVAGLMPHVLRAGAEVPITSVVLVAEELQVMPNGCADAVCGRGSPAPTIPTLTITAVDATLVGGLLFALIRLTRRFRTGALALPRGTATGLFHPPQFSSFDLI
ncbi:MAG TPA: hypothetical protein VGL48_16075 [Acidimicrobiales bacterium]